MNDAGLDQGLREHRLDGLGEALQPIDDGDQHVLDAAVLQLGHHAQPELGAFALLDPQSEDLLVAFRAHAARGARRARRTPRATWTALLRTMPSSRTLTRRASKNTSG